MSPTGLFEGKRPIPTLAGAARTRAMLGTPACSQVKLLKLHVVLVPSEEPTWEDPPFFFFV